MVSRCGWCVVIAVALCAAPWVGGARAEEPAKPRMETVLAEELESAEGLEVIVSVVEIPADTALPKHYHPGEEFAYVVEGSVIVWMEGEAEREMKAGESAKVPLERVHTARTGGEPAKLVVFRVHRKGEPERIPVAEDG